ncbi:hypothetical protein BGX27_004615 [Mortierella sp. AM989]|nr:hypothetical protein BGX27_004615 [Mortierella sp. AM989]
MPKRQRDDQLRQVTPAEATTSILSAIPPPRQSSPPALPTETGESSSAALKSSSFWAQVGMDTFIDWITNPHNHERLYKKNPIAGQKPKDIRQEVARFVNSRHNTKWTELQVKSKIAYTKQKYREATKLNSIGQGHVTTKQLEICPEFTRLHEVYGARLATNPPPPRRSESFGDELIAADETDDECGDLEDPSDTNPNSNSDAQYKDLQGDQDKNEDAHAGPSNKHRKGNDLISPTSLSKSVEKMQEMTDQQLKAYDENMNRMRQRELAVEQREKELSEKLLGLAQEASKRAQEARERLRQELAAERAEQRQELAVERAEQRQELAAERAEQRQELAAERAQFKKEMAVERAEIKNERDEIMALKAKNAALNRELEVRTVRPPKYQ